MMRCASVNREMTLLQNPCKETSRQPMQTQQQQKHTLQCYHLTTLDLQNNCTVTCGININFLATAR